MRTAVLIDGGFFLKRYHRLAGSQPPVRAAKRLHWMCLEHLKLGVASGSPPNDLYRIFYYDCPPLDKKAHNPVTKKAIDFSQTPLAAWRLQFLEELKKLRKVAIRLGYLNDRQGRWTLHKNT